LVPLLTESGCVSFKVGATPSFLARPDKFVAYFADRETMLRIARVASQRLSGIPAQGVPFSFPVDAAGLVSFGFDPPHRHGELTSWRIWLCSQIAHAMTTADPGVAVGAAHRRLIEFGIDPAIWQAPLDFWERNESY